MELSVAKINFVAPNNTIYQATSQLHRSDILPKQLVQQLMKILNLGDLLPVNYYLDMQCSLKLNNQYLKNGDSIYVPVDQSLFLLWQQRIKESKKKKITEKQPDFQNTAQTKEQLKNMLINKDISHYSNHEQDQTAKLITRENSIMHLNAVNDKNENQEDDLKIQKENHNIVDITSNIYQNKTNTEINQMKNMQTQENLYPNLNQEYKNSQQLYENLKEQENPKQQQKNENYHNQQSYKNQGQYRQLESQRVNEQHNNINSHREELPTDDVRRNQATTQQACCKII